MIGNPYQSPTKRLPPCQTLTILTTSFSIEQFGIVRLRLVREEVSSHPNHYKGLTTEVREFFAMSLSNMKSRRQPTLSLHRTVVPHSAPSPAPTVQCDHYNHGSCRSTMHKYSDSIASAMSATVAMLAIAMYNHGL